MTAEARKAVSDTVDKPREQRHRRRHSTCVWRFVNSQTDLPYQPGDLLVHSLGGLYRLRFTNSNDGLPLASPVMPPWDGAKAIIRENGTKKKINHWPLMYEKGARTRMEMHSREVWWVDAAADDIEQRFLGGK